MREGDAQDGGGGSVGKDAGREERERGESPLDDKEETIGEETKNDETDHGGGIPEEDYAAELDTQEEEHSGGGVGQAAKPVDAFEAGEKWSARIVDFEEEEEEGESEAIAGKIDPEAPAPADVLGEAATNQGADRGGERPS